MTDKFLCDEMLAGLGRWLRVAGYDTEIVTETILDRDVLMLAKKEKRLLLTRDREFLEMSDAKGVVIYLSVNTIEECAHQLSTLVKINWLYRPFSRCLVCNSLLEKAPENKILEQVPEDIRRQSKLCQYCSRCDKVYWMGSHTKRMLKKLQTWKG